jgi:ankyrin repeat protein
MMGNNNIVLILLENNANPNAVDINQNTPLHYAMRAKNINDDLIDLINNLVTYGADINSKNKPAEETPLFYSIDKGDCWLPEQRLLVQHMIDLGADLNTRRGNYHGMLHNDTMLHVAIAKYGIEECVLLLQNSADVYVKNAKGFNAIEYAMSTNNEDMIPLINDYLHHKRYCAFKYYMNWCSDGEFNCSQDKWKPNLEELFPQNQSSSSNESNSETNMDIDEMSHGNIT